MTLCAASLVLCGLLAQAGGPPTLLPPAGGKDSNGTLRLLSEAPKSLDPREANSVYESIPLNQIFNGLVTVDASLRVLPSLATTWTISRDGRIYTFHLRRDVRFHDGSPFTAEDVVFTFRHLLKSNEEVGPNVACSYLAIVQGARSFMEGRSKSLPGVKALDPHTVQISLERPYLSFLEVLAMDGLKILPGDSWRRMGDKAFDRAPVGTGPFRFGAWNDARLLLVANPEHFAGKPHLNQIEIKFYRENEEDGGAARFERKEIDVLEVPSDALARLQGVKGVRIHRYQDLNLAFLGICATHPPLNDVRVRQAIAHAIDRDRIVQDAPRYRRTAIGILPPGMQAYSPEPKALAFDPERARRLLAEAGHPGGRGLPTLPLFCGASRTSVRKTAEKLRADLAAVGIRVEIRASSWAELSSAVDEHRAPLFLLNWLADLSDPDSFLRSLFEAGGASNYFDFHDERTEGLLEGGAREMNPVVRARIYRGIEQRILELAPIVPLYHPVSHLAVRTEVTGFEPGPLGISSVSFGRVRIGSARGL